MKKIVCFLLAAVSVLSGQNNLYAQSSNLVSEDILTGSSEFEEISALQDEMVLWMEGSENESAQESAVCYNQALKIYDGAGVLQMKTDDAGVILDMLEQNGHIWLVPAEINGEFYELTIAKGLPLSESGKKYLTETEQQEILDQEGKWTITESGKALEGYQSVWDRIKTQLENLKDCDRVILVNNLPGFQYPVLFGFKDRKAVSIADIGYGYSAISDYEEEVQSRKAKRTDSNGVYDFKELTAYAEPYCNRSADLIVGGAAKSDGGGFDFLFLGLPIVAVAVLAVTAVYQGRKRKVKR